MQSICTLLPNDLAAKVIDARAQLAAEPSCGRLYDPPSSHFTLQLAEDYEWQGLVAALQEFASNEDPFEARTLGLLLGGDRGLDVLVLPHADTALKGFQERIWEVVTPFVKGHVRKSDTPGGWLPHVTIKRGGDDPGAVARGVSSLIGRDFNWSFVVDNIALQHDPGMNSRTHYQRYVIPLRGAKRPGLQPDESNATIFKRVESDEGNAGLVTILTCKPDTGSEHEHRCTAPEMVRLIAAARSSDVYFEGARCRCEGDVLNSVIAATPNPIEA